MPAGSGPGVGDRARLSADCTQKLLFLWEGGCEGRIPSCSPFGWGRSATHPTAAGRPSPPSLGAVAAASTSGPMGFGWGGANWVQKERGSRSHGRMHRPSAPKLCRFFHSPPPPCQLLPLSISQRAAGKGMDDFCGPPPAPLPILSGCPPPPRRLQQQLKCKIINQPRLRASHFPALQQIPTVIIHPTGKKKEKKNPKSTPPHLANHPPPPAPYIWLAGRLLVPAVGPGPGFGAMLQLLAGGRQVHKGSGGGGGGRLRGGERAARRLSILCGGRACRRRGGAE